jgi:soluble lytic murein transglycosylase
VTAYEEADARARAIAVAEEAAQGFSAGRRADAYTRAGVLRQEDGDVDGARAAFRKAIAASESAYDAARRMSDLRGLTLDDRLAIGRIYLRGGNMARAAPAVLAYLDAGRGTAAERQRLRLDLGRGFFRAGQYDDAERTLRAVAENAPAALAAPALYDAARAQYRRGNVTQARATLRSVASRFPGSGTAARAYYLLADLDQDDGRLDDAAANFQRAIDTGADSEEVGLAYMRIAGIRFATGDYAAARDAFEKYRARYPSGRRLSQATYWSALARLELGDTAGARERLAEVRRTEPMSYYAARAADRLDAPYIAALNLAETPPVAPLDTGAARELERVDLLRDAGWDDAAAYEMQRARRAFGSDAASKYALAEALNERGFTTDGISIGWELRRREPWNRRLLRIVYPFPFRDVIVAEAARHGIDPFLAAGLIRQESLFNPRAVSPAGAVGLMQVMPSTGTRIARRLGMRFETAQLRDASVNVTLGMQFLADMINDYDGRLDAVLAAYNAGPSRVERWRSFPEWRHPELFSERIPFAETRDYVKIVQQNARLYAALYGPSARSD